MVRRGPAVAFGALTALTLVAALAACAPAAPPTPVESPTPSTTSTPAAPTPSATPPEPTATSTPGAPEAIGVDCAKLLPIDAVYELNPNLSVVPDVTAPAGSVAEALAAKGGVVCDLVHNSSQAIVHVAAATPGSEALAALRQASGESDVAPIRGFEVRVDPGTGALVAFRDEFVVSVEADAYFDTDTRERALEIAIAAIA